MSKKLKTLGLLATLNVISSCSPEEITTCETEYQAEYITVKSKRRALNVLNPPDKNHVNLIFIENPEAGKDKDVVLAALEHDSSIFHKYASDELINDRDVILVALKKDGLLIRFINDELKNDKTIASIAVKQNGLALEHLNINLQKDKEIVLEAIKQNYKAFYYANNDLKIDNNFILNAIKQDIKLNKILIYANTALMNDHEIALNSLKEEPLAKKCLEKFKRKCSNQDQVKTDRNPPNTGLSRRKRDLINHTINTKNCNGIQNIELIIEDDPEGYQSDQQPGNILLTSKDPFCIVPYCTNERYNDTFIGLAYGQRLKLYNNPTIVEKINESRSKIRLPIITCNYNQTIEAIDTWSTEMDL